MPQHPTLPLHGLKKFADPGNDGLRRVLSDLAKRARAARTGRLEQTSTEQEALRPLLRGLGWSLGSQEVAVPHGAPSPGAPAADWLLFTAGAPCLASWARPGAQRLGEEGEVGSLLELLRRHRLRAGILVSDIELVAIRQRGAATPLNRFDVVHLVLDACDGRDALRAMAGFRPVAFAEAVAMPVADVSEEGDDVDTDGATGDTDVGLSPPVLDSLRAENAADEARERVLVGSRLREFRELAGLEIDTLAKQLRRSPETVQAWEQGTEMPTYRIFLKLAQTFGCELDDLLEGIEI